MIPRSYETFMQLLASFEQFAGEVNTASADPALRAKAETQLTAVENVRNVLNFMFVDEGRDAHLLDAVEAEIHRRPRLPNELSCRPIFIIGNRRSGTTLLAYLMNASANISALPETFFCGSLVENDALFEAGVNQRVLDEPFPRYLGRLAKLADSIYADRAKRQGKSRWVSKEVFISDRLDLLDALFDYRAQFVYAVRHGVSVAHSCATRYTWLPEWVRGAKDLGVRQTTLKLERYLREWILNNDATVDFYERNRDRCHMVRYEDFVKAPAERGAALFEFLGEPWDDGILERMRGQQLRGMGDNKIHRTGGRIVAEPGPCWTDWPRPLIETLASKANPTLARLGYAPLAIDERSAPP